MRLLVGLLFFVSLAAQAQVQIETAWVRATPPGANVAAGYMIIRNNSASPERLVGAASPATARIEMHTHIRDGEILRMREVKAYDVPARGTLELKPGGGHLMFVDIRQPFKEGEKIPVVLRFENARELRVDFHVGRLAAPPAHHKH